MRHAVVEVVGMHAFRQPLPYSCASRRPRKFSQARLK